MPKGDIFIFPSADGSAKLAGKGSDLRTPDRIRHDIEAREEHRSALQREMDEPILQSNNKNKTTEGCHGTKLD